MSQKIRRYFDFTPEFAQKLAGLKGQIESPSDADTVRRAVNLYAALVEHSKEGSTIQIVKPDGEKVSVLIY